MAPATGTRMIQTPQGEAGVWRLASYSKESRPWKLRLWMAPIMARNTTAPYPAMRPTARVETSMTHQATGRGSVDATAQLRPSSSLATATTCSGSKPNFFWSSLRGAEAPKVFMPMVRPDRPT
jgi:hypothetical protein